MPKCSTTTARQARKKPKFYAVRVGRQPGIYEAWPDAERQVVHFPGAMHKSFPTRGLALEYLTAFGAGTPTSSRPTQPPPPYSRTTRPIVDISDDIHVPDADYADDRLRFTDRIPRPNVTDLLPDSDTDGSAALSVNIVESSLSRCSHCRQQIQHATDPQSREAGPSFWNHADSQDRRTFPLPHLLDRAHDGSSESPEPSKAISSLLPVPVDHHAPLAVPTDPPLSSQQQMILDQILGGKNYFFTGPAGTGKSVLLRTIVRAFKERLDKERVKAPPWTQDREAKSEVKSEAGEAKSEEREAKSEDGTDVERSKVSRWRLAVCASTGIAAVNIGGTTLHSWAAIGLGRLDWTILAANIMRQPDLVERWRSTSAILIDEISMIDAELLEKIDMIAQTVRSDARPFGGLQIIASGDFFQLPPVPGTDSQTGKKLPVRMAFEAECWNTAFANTHMAELGRVFRQGDDSFVRLLSEMRRGAVRPGTVALLRTLSRPLKYDDSVEPVALLVENRNTERLARLPGAATTYAAIDSGGVDTLGRSISGAAAVKLLDESTTWPRVLNVKLGAQVMLLTNVSTSLGLVNGSTGVIVDFATMAEASVERCYIPLKMFPTANMALKKYPIVEFIPARFAPMAMPKRVLVCDMQVTVDNPDGSTAASRVMVPLKLAWALTIHKSQGQTLERVSIDLTKVFEHGQTYVALSRATSLEGMQLIGFTEHKVMVNPKVVEWSKKLKLAQRQRRLQASVKAEME